MLDYIVQSGDRLGDIAYAHGTTISELVRINQLTNATLIRPGQVLKIPSATWL